MSAAQRTARQSWRDLVDELIPGGDGLPPASAVGLHDDQLEKVLQIRPDLRAELEEALDVIAGLPPAAALAVLRSRPALFETVTLIVAGGYLMSEPVTTALGYRYADARPVNSEDVRRAVDDGLLDRVIERGPIYRLPPDAPPGAFAAFDR